MIGRFLIFLAVVLAFIPVFGQTEGESFYAYYTSISKGEEFEDYSRTGDYPDIKVVVNDQIQVVFWRGSSYLPCLQSE